MATPKLAVLPLEILRRVFTEIRPGSRLLVWTGGPGEDSMLGCKASDQWLASVATADADATTTVMFAEAWVHQQVPGQMVEQAWLPKWSTDTRTTEHAYRLQTEQVKGMCDIRELRAKILAQRKTTRSAKGKGKGKLERQRQRAGTHCVGVVFVLAVDAWDVCVPTGYRDLFRDIRNLVDSGRPKA